ncbi:flagellin N-terminal helical domain-containing protein [Aquabacterium parvum]|jgi:flagellin|uniref:flagellin N-terminal helical domain-containing protein n=1 Tax=Aquabacterium parvum TaxID=70584 RepID=UPI000718B370|nr:flagellin [Aquabacterium parvum]MBU0915115.1 flagellin FliC [Gammaproteobacteria bacterium]
MDNSVNTNVVALNAQRNLSTSQSSLSMSMQRLSSGLRVNSARDDAAGLAIAERMSAQIKGMNVAVRNANDGISLAQTAEGALGKIGDNLQRMRELAVQSRNATNSDGDRANLQKEFKQLQAEIDRTVQGTKFNGTALFASGASTTLSFQVGAGTDATDRIDIDGAVLGGGTAGTATVVDSTAATATADLLATVTSNWDGTNGIAIGGAASGVATNIATTSQIDDAINVIDKALDTINDQRASFGASQNRFEAVISNLQTNIENQTASRGRIVDADFATETANLSRAQILQQAGTAMVAQANQLPQQVLSLLR